MPWKTVSLLKVRQRLVEAVALCPHDPALAQTLGLGAPTVAPRAAGSDGAASRPDAAAATQSGLDGGFQRLVSHGRRRAPRPADRARSVQPLRTVSASVAQPGRSARAPRDAAALWPAGVARRDSRGQWFAVWRQRRAGAVAPLGLVAAAGHPGRVHPAGPSGRQRGVRTISRLLPTRGGGGGSRASGGDAAALDALAGPLQRAAPARSAGPKDARASLSEEPPRLSRSVGASEIPPVAGRCGGYATAGISNGAAGCALSAGPLSGNRSD